MRAITGRISPLRRFFAYPPSFALDSGNGPTLVHSIDPLPLPPLGSFDPPQTDVRPHDIVRNSQRRSRIAKRFQGLGTQFRGLVVPPRMALPANAEPSATVSMAGWNAPQPPSLDAHLLLRDLAFAANGASQEAVALAGFSPRIESRLRPFLPALRTAQTDPAAITAIGELAPPVSLNLPTGAASSKPARLGSPKRVPVFWSRLPRPVILPADRAFALFGTESRNPFLRSPAVLAASGKIAEPAGISAFFPTAGRFPVATALSWVDLTSRQGGAALAALQSGSGEALEPSGPPVVPTSRPPRPLDFGGDFHAGAGEFAALRTPLGAPASEPEAPPLTPVDVVSPQQKPPPPAAGSLRLAEFSLDSLKPTTKLFQRSIRPSPPTDAVPAAALWAVPEILSPVSAASPSLAQAKLKLLRLIPTELAAPPPVVEKVLEEKLLAPRPAVVTDPVFLHAIPEFARPAPLAPPAPAPPAPPTPPLAPPPPAPAAIKATATVDSPKKESAAKAEAQRPLPTPAPAAKTTAAASHPEESSDWWALLGSWGETALGQLSLSTVLARLRSLRVPKFNFKAAKPVLMGITAMALIAFLRSPLAPSPSGLENFLDAQFGDQAAYYLVEEAPGRPETGWAGPGFDASSGDIIPAVGLTLHPGSLNRVDYQFDFETRLARGGIGWVFRARDDANYCLYRIKTAPRGAPQFRLERTLIADGKPVGETATIELPDSFHEGEYNKISVRVRGETASLLINGHGVDYWTQQAHAAGGVGFLAEAGDTAPIQNFACFGNEDNFGLFLWGARQMWSDLKSLF